MRLGLGGFPLRRLVLASLVLVWLAYALILLFGLTGDRMPLIEDIAYYGLLFAAPLVCAGRAISVCRRAAGLGPAGRRARRLGGRRRALRAHGSARLAHRRRHRLARDLSRQLRRDRAVGARPCGTRRRRPLARRAARGLRRLGARRGTRLRSDRRRQRRLDRDRGGQPRLPARRHAAGRLRGRGHRTDGLARRPHLAAAGRRPRRERARRQLVPLPRRDRRLPRGHAARRALARSDAAGRLLRLGPRRDAFRSCGQRGLAAAGDAGAVHAHGARRSWSSTTSIALRTSRSCSPRRRSCSARCGWR